MLERVGWYDIGETIGLVVNRGVGNVHIEHAEEDERPREIGMDIVITA